MKKIIEVVSIDGAVVNIFFESRLIIIIVFNCTADSFINWQDERIV